MLARVRLYEAEVSVSGRDSRNPRFQPESPSFVPVEPFSLPELTLRLKGEAYGEVFSPEAGYQEGYAFGKELVGRGVDFSALFAFNDISAIGAMRAFEDAGRRVPQDVSVVGFDDIQSSPFHRPSLTTVRQPLREMGEKAARILVRQLAGDTSDPDFVTVQPELVARQSTASVLV